MKTSISTPYIRIYRPKSTRQHYTHRNLGKENAACLPVLKGNKSLNKIKNLSKFSSGIMKYSKLFEENSHNKMMEEVQKQKRVNEKRNNHMIFTIEETMLLDKTSNDERYTGLYSIANQLLLEGMNRDLHYIYKQQKRRPIHDMISYCNLKGRKLNIGL